MTISPRRQIVGVLTLAVLAAALLAAPAQAKKIAMYPSPGTKVASSSTQISFVGLKPKQLGRIGVFGSKTGRHAGRLRAHSGRRGVSFLPNRGFRANEWVTVRTRHAIFGAGRGKARFKIGNFRGKAAPPPALPAEGNIPPDAVTFRSRPDIKVPRVTVDTPAQPGVSPGYVFFAPKVNGPMIVDNQGELVWYRGGPTADFQVQRYAGKPVLTWWQGPFNGGGYTKGTFLIYDQRYRQVKRVFAGNGYSGDLHEFRLTKRGTAFIPAYKLVFKDLRPFGGPRRAPVLDSVAQEIDIRTGLVVWEWHSMGNVALGKSQVPAPDDPRSAWDYFHINSIDQDEDGDILISARNTSAVYKVDKQTGKVIWTMGGRKPTVRPGKGTMTAWQHDFERQPGGALSIFDNGAAPPLHKMSRAMVVSVRGHGKQRKSAIVRQYVHPKKLLAASQGSTQLLPNGNVFVGWGSEPYFTEFSRSGRVLFDAHFAARNSSYRSFRGQWTGMPRERPAIATEGGQGSVRAWVSWNGDTRVASWRLLAGPSPDSMAPVATTPRSGFETQLSAATEGPFLKAQGLAPSGKVLGSTEAVQVGQRAR